MRLDPWCCLTLTVVVQFMGTLLGDVFLERVSNIAEPAFFFFVCGAFVTREGQLPALRSLVQQYA